MSGVENVHTVYNKWFGRSSDFSYKCVIGLGLFERVNCQQTTICVHSSAGRLLVPLRDSICLFHLN